MLYRYHQRIQTSHGVRLALAISLTVFFQSAAAQTGKALSLQKINRLLPVKINGYRLTGEPKSSSTQIGSISYTMCERTFTAATKTIRILLFDYAEAPVMFSQAMKKWGEVPLQQSDSISFQPINVEGASGWESSSGAGQHTQVILGIKNRYFFTLSGEHVSLPALKEILLLFDFEKFPQ